MLNKPLLYLVTDKRLLIGRKLTDVVEAAITGGVNIVQLRDKSGNIEEIIEDARELKELTAHYEVPLIINDNPEIAKKVNADGVHLGASDDSVADAREYLGFKYIIGGSARDNERAKYLERQGADYLGVGAIFGTKTKADAMAISPDVLKSVAQSVNIPVVAIGGVNADNILRLSDTGICGVAVVSAIMACIDVKDAAARIKHNLNIIM